MRPRMLAAEKIGSNSLSILPCLLGLLFLLGTADRLLPTQELQGNDAIPLLWNGARVLWRCPLLALSGASPVGNAPHLVCLPARLAPALLTGIGKLFNAHLGCVANLNATLHGCHFLTWHENHLHWCLHVGSAECESHRITFRLFDEWPHHIQSFALHWLSIHSHNLVSFQNPHSRLVIDQNTAVQFVRVSSISNGSNANT
mmetsp:Transcript_21523/g.50173  ORF Transcript_21523/g.50173 Transcript_21523/m.50173 type:complete len:201 (-) Transcript_21523:491-1093(-)